MDACVPGSCAGLQQAALAVLQCQTSIIPNRQDMFHSESRSLGLAQSQSSRLFDGLGKCQCQPTYKTPLLDGWMNVWYIHQLRQCEGQLGAISPP